MKENSKLTQQSPAFSTDNPIRVLHIFAPSFRQRFTGPVVQWRYYFSRWDDPRVVHSVLDTETGKLVDSRRVFDFQYAATQRTTSKRERITWVFSLFMGLIKHRQAYDILHVHVLWWGGLLIGPWSRLAKCPAVYESVLLSADTPGGIIKERLGQLKLWCLKSYARILAISEHLAEDFLKHGFTPEQVYLNMNSVDTELFKPSESVEQKVSLRTEHKIPPQAMVVLFVGSVIERKGVDTLIQAFIRAHQDLPELYLLIAGAKEKYENPSLDEAFVSAQINLLQESGLYGRVKFLGLIQNRQQLAEYYRLSDIFVLPSRNEGLPSVLLEAMSSGLPVIISDLPVLKKIVCHDENGLIVPVDNSEAVQQSITRLCTDQQFSAFLSSQARSLILRQHGYKAWQSKMIYLYKSLY